MSATRAATAKATRAKHQIVVAAWSEGSGRARRARHTRCELCGWSRNGAWPFVDDAARCRPFIAVYAIERATDAWRSGIDADTAHRVAASLWRGSRPARE